MGCINIDVYKLNIDLLSFSAHKFYGPKGIGGLFLRSYSPNVKLSPIMHGGGHERGLRSGTLNIPLIIGMSEALMLANKSLGKKNDHLKMLSMKIFEQIQNIFPNIKLNGHKKTGLLII